MTLKARITAIDRFIKGCKEDGIYDDLKAACVMAGWDSLAGALTPLKGAAPTNSGLSAYDRGIGITGDGTNYINTNRGSGDDGLNDFHVSVYASSFSTGTENYLIGSRNNNATYNAVRLASNGRVYFYNRNGSSDFAPSVYSGCLASSRDSASDMGVLFEGETYQPSSASVGNVDNRDLYVLALNDRGSTVSVSDATASFYSIGSSLGSDPATGLAALDARVSTLMADLRAIEETGFDRDALAYIRAVEEADGAFLETSVKIAINNLVSGLKADGLWESMASSCLLCGPRTLAGALVPLKGDAPTAYGFVDGDYDRSNGITGDGTSYLDSNRANDADPQDSKHLATYVSSPATGVVYFAGAGAANDTVLRRTSAAIQGRVNRNADAIASAGTQDSTGLIAVSRQSDSLTVLRVNGANESNSFAPNTYVSDDIGIFATISGGSPGTASDATISFYSTGSSLDLATLDSHISSYVTAIGAAL